MRPLFVMLFLSVEALAGSKADPSSWILWRAAPIAFPDSITPQVPELMRGEPLIDFGKDGSDLTVVMPDGLGQDYDSKALDWAKRFVIDKVGAAFAWGKWQERSNQRPDGSEQQASPKH
jgi:hypothetical protein